MAPDGTASRLTADEFRLEPGRVWTSPTSGARYPLAWRVLVPGSGINLSVTAAVENQELSAQSTGVTYWEGAIDVTGGLGDSRAEGRGYLEMTGYAGPSMGTLLR